MGTDIHLFIEHYRDGQWHHVVDPNANKWSPNEWDFSRGYDCFAIMANVRNGIGFGGIATGGGFVPLTDGRGVPADASEVVRDDVKEDCYHSATWFTLAELVGYDFSRVTTKQGVVSIGEYAVYKRQGHPNAWCGDVSGPGVRRVNNEEMDAAMSALSDEDRFAVEARPMGMLSGPNHNLYTLVRWTTTYAEAASPLVTLRDELVKVAEVAGIDPAHVRLVMGFDS